ncbi:adhesion G-protein coupled receptor F1-like [Stegodyphus dumicola]|uniref:adhesion G-protein coupled receptor F1-like n=1 Tax=Stegodyphus dumicola TaxID=202533 RepID=UPI0015B1482E|nr:adhesion G-protein coupled receptor F1-like [Stegodyphus dumicola]
MNTQGNILDISSEVSSQEDIVLDEEAPLLVFRVIGCTVVTLLVGFTIIIYVSSGMFHLDCLAQICSESCILAAYMFLLMTTTETSRIDTGMCLATAIFLHFLFISAFLFSLLEVVCMCQALISFFHKMAPLTVSNVLIIGWVVPGIIAGVSAIIWYKEYTTKSNCWVVASQPPFWPTVIPVGICVAVQVLLLIIVLTVSDVPLSVPQSQYKRAK